MADNATLEAIKNLIYEMAESLHNNADWNPDGNDEIKIPSVDDKFKIDMDYCIDNLTNYWNKSVQELLEKINGDIPIIDEDAAAAETGEIISKNHDAAFSFEDNPYVSPDPNLKNEAYLEAREDYIESVLENDENLGYTINKKYNDNKEPIDNLNKYITRLLMPKYARRVEVEDLDRNFWVIGQNLSLLNNLMFNEEYSPWAALLQEIVDLWENVYALWQAILYLAKKIGDIENQISEIAAQAAKTKVQLSYGWAWCNFGPHWLNEYDKDGTLGNRILTKKSGSGEVNNPYVFELADSIELKPSDSKVIGFLPLLEKEEIQLDNNTKGYVCYLPYNKTITDERLDNMTDEELEERFVKNFQSGEVIHIERTFGNRPAREILKAVQTRNFVLVSANPEGAIPILDNLKIIPSPYLSILQFYRDFIYSFYEHTLDEIQDNWVHQQAGYIKYLQFEDSNYILSEDTLIPDRIKNSVENINPEIRAKIKFILAITYYDTIKDIRNVFDNDGYSITEIINEFFSLYNIFSKELGLLTDNTIQMSVLMNDPEIDENEKYIIPYFGPTESEDCIIELSNIDENGIEKYCNYYRRKITENVNGNSIDSSNSIVKLDPIYLFVNMPKSVFISNGENWENGDSWIITNQDGKVEYCKFSITDEEKQIIKNSKSIDWDLLSMLAFPDNFHSKDGDTNKGEAKHDYYGLTEEEIDNDFKPVIQQVLVGSGWWKKGVGGIGGSSYIYPRNNSLCKGLWFDFIKDPTNSRLEFLDANLRSLTMNEYDYNGFIGGLSSVSVSNAVWSAHHYYNVDITIPFVGAKNTSYWDFIRLGKPYPSLAEIIKAKAGGNYDYYGVLNDEYNYIAYANENDKVAGHNYCIDGFYGFDNFTNYPTKRGNGICLIEGKDYKIEKVYEFNDNGITHAAYNVYREHITNGNNYYGALYRHSLIYEIASMDLINAYKEQIPQMDGDTFVEGDIKEGYTRIRNTNLLDDPTITIQYLNGVTYAQQIDIINSKDRTQGDWIPKDEIIQYQDYEIFAVGGFFPKNLAYLQKLQKIESPEEENHFDTNTFGINAYGVLHTDDMKTTGWRTTYNQPLIFVNYRNATKEAIDSATNIDDIKDILDNKTHQDEKLLLYADDFLKKNDNNELAADIAFLEALSTTTIKAYYDNNKSELTNDKLLLTKYHVNFWLGDTSSQWQMNIIEGAYKVSCENEEVKITKMCSMIREDSYWADNVFYKPGNVAKWRNLRVSNKIKSATTEGALMWYDYNVKDKRGNVKEVYKDADLTSSNKIYIDNNIEYRMVAYAWIEVNNKNNQLELFNSHYRLIMQNNQPGTFITPPKDDNNKINNDYIFPKGNYPAGGSSHALGNDGNTWHFEAKPQVPDSSDSELV